MKRLVFVLVFTTFAFKSFSQKVRFTDTTNHWIVGHGYWCSTGWSTTFGGHQYNGSTNLNGMDYRILDSQQGYNYLIREDTIEGKVYYREYQSSMPLLDTNEYIGYDYKWQVGDTVTRWVVKPTGKVPATYLVATIDSVLINNFYHKVWTFSELTGNSVGSRPVIEGIGCVVGPTWVFNLPEYWAGSMSLYCFTSNGTKPLINLLTFNNTHSCIESVSDESVENNVHEVFPNPVTKSSCLMLARFSKGNLVIWNALGQEVYRQELANLRAIPVGEHLTVPGMYYYRIIDQSQPGLNIYNGSFIRE